MKLGSCHKCLGSFGGPSQKAYDGQYISKKRGGILCLLNTCKEKTSFLGVSVLVEPGNGLTALNFEFSLIFEYYPFYEVRKDGVMFFPPNF